MTRVTNFGRKRTYLEAGFAAVEEASKAQSPPPAATPVPAFQPTAEAAAPTTDPVAAEGGDGAEPARKKRKRHRPKKKSKDAIAEGAPADGAVVEGESAVSGEGPASAKTEAAPKKEKKKKPLKKKKEYVSPGEQRRLARIKERNDATTCFACRERGHAARDCPKSKDGAQSKAPAVGICYRCGSTRHNLSRCRELIDPLNPLPFASCFVCSGKGHLAGACPQNKDRGVYPNGGCCKICGDTTHLAKDCTTRKNDFVAKSAVGTGREAGPDEDDFMIMTRKVKQVEQEEKHQEKFSQLLDAAENAPARFGSRPNPIPSRPQKKKVVVF